MGRRHLIAPSLDLGATNPNARTQTSPQATSATNHGDDSAASPPLPVSRTQKDCPRGIAGSTVCNYPRDLGSTPSDVKFIKKWNSLKLIESGAHVSEVGSDPETVPTLSGPVSAWSSVFRFRAWRWNVVRVITSMYPPSVQISFPKYGNCFGKWALA